MEKELRRYIRKNLLGGHTMDEIVSTIKEVESEIAAELAKEDEVARIRLAAAEAMCNYINLVYGGDTISVEEAYEMLDLIEQEFSIIPPKKKCSPIVHVCECDDEQEGINEIKRIIEKLGL